jgi:signal transduction histidine kinase/signal recognition particle receptor subunit beta
MARWCSEDKSLQVKVVYYGPACGGKTTNLAALHGLLDARSGRELLTVKTRDESTLFFDLLPFELDDVLGHRVEIQLFSVPGQVRYDATRKVVLRGADAIVFVADSRPSRREQNIWSLQNLRLNMRHEQIDPDRVPILYQINKRDVPEAAPAAEVADWLGVANGEVIPAVATRGEGVLETLTAVCHAALEHGFDAADAEALPAFDPEVLAPAIDRALAGFAERADRGWSARKSGRPPETPIMLTAGDLLEGAIETSVRLGEGRSSEAARAHRLAREADGFRRLAESLCRIAGRADRPHAVAAALDVAREVLDAAAVTLVGVSPAGPLRLEGASGRDEDPLLACPSGRRLLQRMLTAGGPCVIDDWCDYCTAEEAGTRLDSIRSVAGVPVADHDRRVIVAYGRRPGGRFESADVRFLAAVARHVAAGLDKARTCEDRATHRSRLERTVHGTGRDRRRRQGSRRAVDRIRERFLESLSGEMRAPVAALRSAAEALREMSAGDDESGPVAESVVRSAELLERQLDDLSRLVRVTDTRAPQAIEAPSTRLLEEALRVAGHSDVRSEIVADPGPGRFDVPALARAVANLIDNAVRFSPPGSPVRVRLEPGRLTAGGRDVEAVTVVVLDRGPGVPEADRERIFAPFSQYGATADGPPRGLGIGLYEARSVARRHGGAVECLPREGGGSEFRLTVPLQPVNAEEPREVVHA